MPVNSELLRSELVSIGRTRTVGMLQSNVTGRPPGYLVQYADQLS